MPHDLSLMIPLVKIDQERRLIVARAAQEVPDKTGEIMDYATARPAFEKWSNEFSELSGGLSKGNVRVMHQKIAAGKVTDISYDDDAKAVDVIMKIVDENEWQKCLQGVYTGVSVGGGYGKKWQDGGLKRYTPIVREISLVDNPCIPTAKFAELVKADGMTEQLELRGVVRTFGEMWREPPKTFGQLFKYEEAQHPRGEGGEWSTTGAVAAGGAALAGAIGTRKVVGAMAQDQFARERRGRLRDLGQKIRASKGQVQQHTAARFQAGAEPVAAYERSLQDAPNEVHRYGATAGLASARAKGMNLQAALRPGGDSALHAAAATARAQDFRRSARSAAAHIVGPRSAPTSFLRQLPLAARWFRGVLR